MLSPREYYDSVAGQYDRLYKDSVSAAENEVVRSMLTRELHASAVVVDLGCGTGLGFELLCRRDFDAHERYIGVDISPEMVRQAARKHGATRFRTGDMQAAPIASSSADLVISLFGSFSHAGSGAAVANEIFRILKPGGRFLVMAYSRLSVRNLTLAAMHRDLRFARTHQTYSIRNASNSAGAPAFMYTSSALKKTFTGFSRVRVDGLNAVLGSPALSWMRAKKGATEIEAFLRMEMNVLRFCPDPAHSLIITGTKP